jgi:SAM-dependent methyltransferase
MQDDKGLKAVFTIPSLYSLFQRAIGANYARDWFIRECLRPRPNDKIIDIGCGPGETIRQLPNTRYIGIDISEPYILEAKRRYGDAALFLHGTTQTCLGDERLRDADLVMCFGVLHHLEDDEVRQLLSFALQNLRPGGRFVGLEPCYLAHQTRSSAWLMSRDRGRNVRAEEQWKSLLRAEFGDSATSVLTGLIRLPYTHIVLEGRK